MSELPLEKLREYRFCDSPIVRGDVPKIEFGDNYNYLLEKICVSAFIFVFCSFIFCPVLGTIFEPHEKFGLIIGLLLAASVVSFYLFYPVFYICRFYYKHRKTPPSEILDRFSKRYEAVIKYLIVNKFVLEPEKPKEEKPKNISVARSKDSSFRLWLGISTGQLVNLWHKFGMAQNQQVSLELEDDFKPQLKHMTQRGVFEIV